MNSKNLSSSILFFKYISDFLIIHFNRLIEQKRFFRSFENESTDKYSNAKRIELEVPLNKMLDTRQLLLFQIFKGLAPVVRDSREEKQLFVKTFLHIPAILNIHFWSNTKNIFFTVLKYRVPKESY